MEIMHARSLYSSDVIWDTMLNNSVTVNFNRSQPTSGEDVCAQTHTENVGSIVFIVVLILILVTSVTGNSLVILGFAFSNALRKRVTNYVIVSLACSDMLFAVMVLPFLISMKLHNGKFCHGEAACYLMQLTDVICNVASILNLFLIAIDRYVAIRLPYRYHTFTKSRVLKLILIVWLFSMCWAFSGIFKWGESQSSTSTNTMKMQSIFSVELTDYCINQNHYFFTVSYIAIYLFPLAVMTITYALVLQTAISHIRAIGKNVPSVASGNFNNNISNDKKNRNQKNGGTQKRELKATKSVAIVYFAFVLCWFPNCVINIISTFDNEHFGKLKISNPDLFAFIYYCLIQVLPMVNTMLNPVIYSFSSKSFRKAFRNVFHIFLERCCVRKFIDRKGARSQSEISTKSSGCSSIHEIKVLCEIGSDNEATTTITSTKL